MEYSPYIINICFLSYKIIDMKVDEKLLRKYEEYLVNKNYKRDTVRRSVNVVDDFKNKMWIKNVEDINYEVIEWYKSILMKRDVPKKSIYYGKNEYLCMTTIWWKIQPIRNFLKWLNVFYNKWVSYGLVELPKWRSIPMDYFEEEEIEKIIREVNKKERYEVNRLRLELLIRMWYTTWMRLSELLNLEVDKCLNCDKFMIRWKWDKDRLVFISDKIKLLLLQYKVVRESKIPRFWYTMRESKWVFISHNWESRGEKLSKQSVCGIFKNYRDTIKGKKFSCHTLRHSFATNLLDKWVDLYCIQKFLWHSNLSTTQTYLHRNDRKLEEIHNYIYS